MGEWRDADWPQVVPVHLRRPMGEASRKGGSSSGELDYRQYITDAAIAAGLSESAFVHLTEWAETLATKDAYPLEQPTHPSPFGALVAFRLAAVAFRWRIGKTLDPFAGTGRIHLIGDDVGFETVGVEIEPEWAVLHERTMLGNALALPFDDATFDAIVTSPTYGNRMADHEDMRTSTYRFTYRHSLGRPLDKDNSGGLQWGDPYRRFHEAAWIEAIRVLADGGLFVLNIKDHIRNGVVVNVSAWHLRTLIASGLTLLEIDPVVTNGTGKGSNNNVRTPVEYVFVLSKGVRNR